LKGTANVDEVPIPRRRQRIPAGTPRPRAANWHLPDDAPDPFATTLRPPARRAHPNEIAVRAVRDSDASLPKLTLPSIPQLPRAPSGLPDDGATNRHARAHFSREPARSARGDDGGDTFARVREHSRARPLAALSRDLVRQHLRITHERAHLPVPVVQTNAYEVADEDADAPPDLAVYRGVSRTRVATRALVQSARSPWSVARLILALCAISFAVWTSLSAAGEPPQPLMASFRAAAAVRDSDPVVSRVRPETQGTRPDLYDSHQQFDDWWNAACSAAVLSEVLTAWGEKGATIGHMIDVMQPDISLNGGLLRAQGFQRGAAAYHYRADLNWHLTYKQLLYITNTLGLPVIVNVRIAYGYYHFFDGGHFLTMTGGDAAGLKIVDSSEYYITYLPLDTFMSMFTGMTAVIVPDGYTYSVP
jgi:hypothetical protein